MSFCLSVPLDPSSVGVVYIPLTFMGLLVPFDFVFLGPNVVQTWNHRQTFCLRSLRPQSLPSFLFSCHEVLVTDVLKFCYLFLRLQSFKFYGNQIFLSRELHKLRVSSFSSTEVQLRGTRITRITESRRIQTLQDQKGPFENLVKKRYATKSVGLQTPKG